MHEDCAFEESIFQGHRESAGRGRSRSRSRRLTLQKALLRGSFQCLTSLLAVSDTLLRPGNMGENHFRNVYICQRSGGGGGLRMPQEERGTGDKEDCSRSQVVRDQARFDVIDDLRSVADRTGGVRMSSHTFKGPMEDLPRPKGPAAANHWALLSFLSIRAMSQTYTQSLFSWNSHAHGEHSRKHTGRYPDCSVDTEHTMRAFIWSEHCLSIATAEESK